METGKDAAPSSSRPPSGKPSSRPTSAKPGEEKNPSFLKVCRGLKLFNVKRNAGIMHIDLGTNTDNGTCMFLDTFSRKYMY